MTPKGLMLGGLALVAGGAAGATYLITQSDGVARFMGLERQESSETTPGEEAPQTAQNVQPLLPAPVRPSEAQSAEAAEAAEDVQAAIAELGTMEERVARIERRIAAAEGSAGRADGLLIAFAARRAIDRGVALGYLEPLLVDRFGEGNERSVAQVITASRNPVKLEDLVRGYEELGPVLRRGAENPGFWDNLKRELRGLAVVYRADQPNPRPRARYDRALVELRLGNVSAALAETMRLPGASAADEWADEARRYIATRDALDRLESAALLSREENATN